MLYQLIRVASSVLIVLTLNDILAQGRLNLHLNYANTKCYRVKNYKILTGNYRGDDVYATVFGAACDIFLSVGSFLLIYGADSGSKSCLLLWLTADVIVMVSDAGFVIRQIFTAQSASRLYIVTMFAFIGKL